MITLSVLPLWYQFFLVGVFGLVLGSFLEVVVTRFHTSASLSGRSRCFSCAAQLRWFELLPIVSYVVLRGRCRSCGSYIPFRLLMVELTAATLCLGLFYLYGFSTTLIWAVPLTLLLLVIALYDVRHLVIPNEFVIALSLLAVGIIGYDNLPLWPIDWVWSPLLSAGLTTAFFGGLWFMSGGRWIGFGDVKLVAPLGVLLTPMAAVSFIVLSFWLGALVMVSIMVLRYLWVRSKVLLFPLQPVVKSHRSFTMKSEVPFAPFIIAAWCLTYFLQLNVLTWADFWLYVFLR